MLEQQSEQSAAAVPQRLKRCQATVIGLGSVGRQVALHLARLEVPHLQLIDPARVDAIDLAQAGYDPSERGQPRALATAAACRAVHPQGHLQTVAGEPEAAGSLGHLVVCCEERLDVRPRLWPRIEPQAELYLDVQTYPQGGRVIAVSDGRSRHSYPGLLRWTWEELPPGRPSPMAALFLAAVVLRQVQLWLKRWPLREQVELHLDPWHMASPC